MAVKVHWFQIEPNLKEYEYKFTGLSTDEKPQDERVALNSLFLELDTGDFYYLKQQASSIQESYTSELFTITAWRTSRDFGAQYATIDDLQDMPDHITVVYDGVSYECTRTNNYWYGAPLDGYVFDFSEIPFAMEDNFGHTNLYSPDNMEHSFTVSWTEIITTEAVWEKIGGGGSGPEPTGELLFNGSVTTEEDAGDYIYAFDQNSLLLNYSSIIVELDGTRYTLELLSGLPDGVFAFGDDEDFSTYPLYLNCVIQVGGSVWDTDLYTAEEKTYSLKIWANSDPVDVDDGGTIMI